MRTNSAFHKDNCHDGHVTAKETDAHSSQKLVPENIKKIVCGLLLINRETYSLTYITRSSSQGLKKQTPQRASKRKRWNQTWLHQICHYFLLKIQILINTCTYIIGNRCLEKYSKTDKQTQVKNKHFRLEMKPDPKHRGPEELELRVSQRKWDIPIIPVNEGNHIFTSV